MPSGGVYAMAVYMGTPGVFCVWFKVWGNCSGRDIMQACSRSHSWCSGREAGPSVHGAGHCWPSDLL